MSSSDNESVVLDFEGTQAPVYNPDEEFEGEFGYSLVKALRGKTVGRRLKRKLFKFAVIEFFCGFALLIIAIEICEFHVIIC